MGNLLAYFSNNMKKRAEKNMKNIFYKYEQNIFFHRKGNSKEFFENSNTFR